MDTDEEQTGDKQAANNPITLAPAAVSNTTRDRDDRIMAITLAQGDVVKAQSILDFIRTTTPQETN